MFVFRIVIYKYSSREMKGTKKATAYEEQEKSSDTDIECSCQILYQDQLSGVGDSDCDCQHCLEANLNAFNQFQNQNKNTLNSTKQQQGNKNGRALSATRVKNENKPRQQMVSKLHRYKSTERVPSAVKNKAQSQARGGERSEDNFEELEDGTSFSNGQLNEFMLITQHRTRKYLDERKKLEQNQKIRKMELEDKIKRNLELLKYTASMVTTRNENKEGQLHPFKWNHSKYKCECNGEVDSEKAKQNCCRKACRRIKSKQGLNTNLAQFKAEFEQKREQILSEARKKREREIESKGKQSCPDKCPNHHNRTDEQKIRKIEEFINKNVQKYNKKQRKLKQQQQEKKKSIHGKLTAIDIKSKQILKRSKKYNQNASRTSFRDSIDQFDTFSQLREENQRRKKIKQQREQMKADPKRKQQLLQKVYEDVEQDWEVQAKKNKDKSKYLTKGDMPELREPEQIYERVAYDAGIKIPKTLKNKAEDSRNQKGAQKQLATNGKKKQTNLNKLRQEEQKKRIEMEIQKKKKQIMEEFRKRNSNNSGNKQIRQQYQQKLQKNNNKTRRGCEREQEPLPKDPYRSNYQTKAGRNSEQIRVHGDPLIEQHHYDQQRTRGVGKGEDMEIFKSNLGTLASKQKLRL